MNCLSKTRFFLTISFTSCVLLSTAQTVVNDNGIRYLIENESAIIARQDKELKGDIVIPDSISYNGVKYCVTSLVSPTNLTAWSSNMVSCEGRLSENYRPLN